ncbi:MAG: GxxExxY protein [Verrucomicrobiota bacterium]
MTRNEETELIYKDESYAIVGACFAVYTDKGCGFLEPVYHECLQIEFELQGIQFLSKPPRTLQYRGRTLLQTFAPDFLCYDKIIVEIKAVSALCDEHRAQVLNYLSATGCQLGLLVNFGHIQEWNTSASWQENMNLRICISEIFASFRVFSGHIPL